MESRRTEVFTYSIVVWPDDLKYLDNFLQKSFAKVEYEASCEDNTILKPVELENLLEYENPDFKRLVSVTIRASDEQILGDNVEVILGQAGFYSSATGSACFKFADIKKQYPIEDEVIKRVRAMRPWYFWLSKMSFKYLLPLLLYGASLALTATSLIKKLFGSASPASTNLSRFTEGEKSVFVLGVLGILFLAGYLIDRSKDYLFPKYFFCIGRQQRSFKKRRNIAYVIFGVIILGILINIASTLILQPFSK